MARLFNSITRPENQPRLWLVLSLAAIGWARLALTGSGACSLGDEFRYWFSAQMLLGASQGDLAAVLAPMFDTAGRPGLALIQLPPVLVQAVVFKLTGLDPRCPDSLLIPQVWNVAVSLAGAWLFFQVGCRVFGFSGKKSAWLTVCFSLLTSSSIYVRHLLPYDCALYLFLWNFLLIEKNRNPFWIGVFTAFSYSVYPGYWPLVLVSGLSFVYKNTEKPFSVKKLARPILLFKTGFVALLVFYEILSRIASKSFIENSLTGGSEFLNYLQLKYDGSLSFLFSYLVGVEAIPGLFLFAGAAAFLIKSMVKTARLRPLSPLETLALGLAVAFAIQTAIGLFSGMKVFYGRLLRPFAAAMVWMAGAAFFFLLEKLGRWPVLKNTAGLAVTGCFLLGFVGFWVKFRDLGYPRDLFFAHGFTQPTVGLEYDIRSKTPPADGLVRQNQFEPHEYFTLPPENAWHPRPRARADSSLLFLNFTAMPVSPKGIFQFDIPREIFWAPVDVRPHFAGFRPYFFEEDAYRKGRFSPDGRAPVVGIFRDKRLCGE